MIRPTKCAGCDAPMFWAISASTGKRMPVDLEPDLVRGNLTIEERPAPLPPLATVGKNSQSLFDQDAPRYLSHFVTCPNSEQWRKRGRPMSDSQLATPGPKRWRTMHR